LKLPCLLNRESTVRDWLEDPAGRIAFEPTFQEMKAHLSATFGAGESGSENIGMDMMGFMMEMPLLSILHFQESNLSVSADDLVDGLLRQVYGSRFPLYF
jgi:beta-glucosidase